MNAQGAGDVSARGQSRDQPSYSGSDPMLVAKPIMAPRTCNILLVYPRFAVDTFWNFAATCKLFGARYPAPPLGLITVAALLPSSWTVRLVDRNAEELSKDDLEWADLVMTGGMLPQQHDTLEVIDLCHAQGKLVAVGGPASHQHRKFTRPLISAFSAKPKASSTSSSRRGKGRSESRDISRPRSLRSM